VRGRRLSVAAVVVVLGALVLTTGAQACSCAHGDPAEALRSSDAAIVGRLIEVIPRGAAYADYRYRIRRVYRGVRMLVRDETISVRSARQATACGLPDRQERPVGLFLRRDPQGRWTAGLCSTIAPRRLEQAVEQGGGRGDFPASADCNS
jgi:hypothetical protein